MSSSVVYSCASDIVISLRRKLSGNLTHVWSSLGLFTLLIFQITLRAIAVRFRFLVNNGIFNFFSICVTNFGVISSNPDALLYMHSLQTVRDNKKTVI